MVSLRFPDPWSSDSDLSDLSPVEDEYAKVDKSGREAPDLGDVTRQGDINCQADTQVG